MNQPNEYIYVNDVCKMGKANNISEKGYTKGYKLKIY